MASLHARYHRPVHIGGHWETRQAPTATQRSSLELASGGFEVLSIELSELIEVDLAQLEADLAAAGAPWAPGRRLSQTRSLEGMG